jgi:hypothetical protein
VNPLELCCGRHMGQHRKVISGRQRVRATAHSAVRFRHHKAQPRRQGRFFPREFSSNAAATQNIRLVAIFTKAKPTGRSAGRRHKFRLGIESGR